MLSYPSYGKEIAQINHSIKYRNRCILLSNMLFFSILLSDFSKEAFVGLRKINF